MYKSSNPFLKCQNADIGPVRPASHPRMYVHPVLGEDQGLIRVIEGKLARITKRIPTLRIDHIHAIMQELVVGIPPIWIHLMRHVAREILVYIDVVEAAEACVQGDRGDQGGPSDQGGQA